MEARRSDWLCRINPRRVENNGNPCEFNYRRYLEGQGIRYMAFFRGGDIIDYRPRWSSHPEGELTDSSTHDDQCLREGGT
ncbi:MAG: DUF4131 domain-containing protein [Marinilabiliales bacterium]|nr:DUF4131 domain-containing protein [Marinilabiliales bacterium]